MVATQGPKVGYDVGPVDRIPLGEGRLVQVGRVPLAVFRTRQGTLYATQARCPHKGGPLADGLIAGCVLACPLHEYGFDLRTGQAQSPDCKSIKTYPVRVNEAGRIIVSLTPSQPVAGG